MLDGIRLVEYLIQKPLQTVVGLLLAAVIWLGVLALQVDKVHAEIARDQKVTEKYQEEQDSMYTLLIRIDENVKHLKNK